MKIFEVTYTDIQTNTKETTRVIASCEESVLDIIRCDLGLIEIHSIRIIRSTLSDDRLIASP